MADLQGEIVGDRINGKKNVHLSNHSALLTWLPRRLRERGLVSEVSEAFSRVSSGGAAEEELADLRVLLGDDE